MAKYNEQTLTNWTKPPSDTEQTKLENSERMVRDAISADEKLKQKSTETFGQGSYANNTNVRLNSDIDINVRYTGGFYFDLPKDKTREDFGITPTSYTFSEFKDDVENALVTKFGRNDVKRKDKCITIIGNSYRIETDVVPTWNYRRYAENGTFVLGAKFFTDSLNKEVVNFPKQHIQNGIDKNTNTYRAFKRLTRLHRKLRYKMIEDGEPVSDNITSFLLECLTWNVPNSTINAYNTWTDRLKQSIIYIHEKTKTEEGCKEWGEVSELLYLFVGRKWSREDVNEYMVQLWNYLEY
ncbi:MAG: nucleotidyltransferase [Bacteroidales bacterium]|nr:nucleotidyltransferase [Bacteroidales bacterium]